MKTQREMWRELEDDDLRRLGKELSDGVRMSWARGDGVAWGLLLAGLAGVRAWQGVRAITRRILP